MISLRNRLYKWRAQSSLELLSEMPHVLRDCCGCVCSHQPSPSEAFYDHLQSTFPSSNLIVMLGDFNAPVGSDFSSWNSVIGPHGVGECNENREQLLDFCAGNQLIITNMVSAQAHSQTYMVQKW